HLRASMLAYAHINLLSMLRRFEPEKAVRVATDSLYIRKTALHKLEGVGTYKPQYPKGYCPICLTHHDKATPRPPRDGIAPAQWRDEGEQLYMPQWHAVYLPNPEYVSQVKNVPNSSEPRHEDPLSRHALSYGLASHFYGIVHVTSETDPGKGLVFIQEGEWLSLYHEFDQNDRDIVCKLQYMRLLILA
ncbi:MAG: hypothetical protein AB2556_12815, partial [Candidatus Thiodiazotropha sp.]